MRLKKVNKSMFSQINYTITSAILKDWTQKEACVIMQFKTNLKHSLLCFLLFGQWGTFNSKVFNTEIIWWVQHKRHLLLSIVSLHHYSCWSWADFRKIIWKNHLNKQEISFTISLKLMDWMIRREKLSASSKPKTAHPLRHLAWLSCVELYYN